MAVPLASEWLTVPEAAERLGISANTVYLEIASGRLPCLRVGPKGGKIRLTEEDLAVYLEACRRAPLAGHGRPLKYIKMNRRA